LLIGSDGALRLSHFYRFFFLKQGVRVMLRAYYLTGVLSLLFGTSQALAASIPFTIHGTSFLEQFAADGNSGSLNVRFNSGPFSWTPAGLPGALAGWDEHSDGLYSYTLGPGEVISDNFFIQPIQSTFTLNSRDASGNALGTIRLSGVGQVAADLDVSRAIIDETTGAMIFRYGYPLDPRSFETLTVTEVNGVFTGMVDVGEQWRTLYAGHQGRVLFPGTNPQEAIYAQPSYGLFSQFIVTNVPEPTTVSLLLIGAAGCGLWFRIRAKRRRAAIGI
jgi:hypothetical protein